MNLKSRGWRGLLFALPWIVGLLIFTIYPFCASLYYSCTDFSVLQKPVWVGLDNYREITGDAVFWQVLGNTLYYVVLAIPAGLFGALGLALLMNAVKRGQWIYSVIFYLPHLIPVTACAILWMWIFNAECGLLNSALRPLFDVLNSFRVWMDPALAEAMKTDPAVLWGPPAWLSSTNWALPSLVLMGLWSVGQMSFIYLAKLQDVPMELYEAAEIDGASTFQKIRHVTLPQVSPIIFFNFIMSIIWACQIFAEPYLMTQGGPDRATTFLPGYIWDNAFMYLRMGYACALSWILFLLILLLTLLAFRLAKDRVYYAGR
jgi:multiple sugar transport system permease protein